MTNDKELGDHLKDLVDVYCNFLLMQECMEGQRDVDVKVTAPKYDYTKKPRRLPTLSPECERAIDNMQAMQTYHRGMDLQNAKDAIFKSREKVEEPEP